MEDKKYLTWDYSRRFGAEIEINSFNGESRCPINELPEGIHYVGTIINKLKRAKVLLHKHGHDHNNDCWVIKPDGSCGMEVCSPVSKGNYGINNVCEVVETFANNSRIKADQRCSLHVHVEISDLAEEYLLRIFQWWVKCEAVFMDAMPSYRKNNRYCQFIGSLALFSPNTKITPPELFHQLGETKYTSINSYHYWYKKRETIEFRIMDNTCCKDAVALKNWLRLVIHFVEMAQKTPILDYQEGNYWSGWYWLDPNDVFSFLGFNENLAPEMQEVRAWFLSRLILNGNKGKYLLGPDIRQYAYKQYEEMESYVQTR